jgi:hypothetical protein
MVTFLSLIINRMIKNTLGIIVAGLCLSMPAFALEKTFNSPDGKMVVTVSDEGGKPSYCVSYNGVEFIQDSPLGLKTNIGDFTQGMNLKDGDVIVKQIDEDYTVPTIKQRRANYLANEVTYTFEKEGKVIFDVVFSIGNNDVAFKYRMYPQGQTLSCIVESESTGFMMPQGTTTFLCPQVKPMGGFARTYPSYETGYTLDEPVGKNGWGEGYTFPCLFKNNDKGWILISETGVSSAYCASRLMGHKDGLYTIGYPQPEENNGNGTVAPGIPLPGETPWRTITIGETLASIVETTVPFDLVKPLYEPSQEYVYGRGSWSWIIGMDGATNYDEQKRYIDFSAAMGYESILIDALWDTQIGRERIKELAEYGAKKGVGIYLWYNSNGYWNDAPQGPRGIMDNTIARRKEMKWMQSIGIRGIKVDFFGGDKQVTMKLYEDILADANDYGILCIFHGCTLPRGWERMYPNYASSEAVLASENLHFSQGNCDNEAFNACIHPFIRNVVGSMDFGGSTLNKFYNANNGPRGSKRKTSDVFALATAVLFQSPVQHFAMAPNNLTDAPEWAINFMKQVPTLWDEVRFIDGYPGKYVVMARRHGNKWFVVAINGQKETLKLKLKLPMFAAGETVQYYSDDKDLNGSLKPLKINKKQEVTLTIPFNGGVVLEK